ncbi:MAG: hypothetical protein IPH44_39310 [Myxococcales bacterium]|jgi:hypothetical protein|nr:hypothetical protein [Myxococcales bacterium]MBK7196405.1 hypothetical protein [Myxococcales bacterium]MBP6846672.1 hypothetical protein [Kofleriaceae bacterium]
MPAAPEFERADDHRLEEPMHTQWTRMMVAPIALAVGLGACSSREAAAPGERAGLRPEPGPAAAAPPAATREPLVDADDFVFQLSEGHGAMPGDQLAIDAYGRVRWSSPQPDAAGVRRLHQIDWVAPPAEVRRLREALARARFFEIPPEHRDPGVSDGTQLFMRVRAGGRVWRVSCDNAFPPAVEAIRAAVAALTTPERRRGFASAAPTRPDDDLGELTRALPP